MDELKGAVHSSGGTRTSRQRSAPALQGPDPDRGGLNVHGPDGQGLGALGAGVGEREGEGLVGRPRRPGGDFEEVLPFIGGKVLVATRVDELEIADQARYFA